MIDKLLIEQIEQQVRDEGNEDYKIDEAKFKRLFLIELNNFLN